MNNRNMLEANRRMLAEAEAELALVKARYKHSETDHQKIKEQSYNWGFAEASFRYTRIIVEVLEEMRPGKEQP